MILRFVLTIIIIYLIYRVMKGFLRSPERTRPEPLFKTRSRTIQGGDLVQDPHCLTYIPESDAFKATVSGETLYFCSEECFKKYQAEQKKKS